MSKDSVANILVIVGVCLLSGAGWLVHPAVGLGTLGVALVAIGIGIVRS